MGFYTKTKALSIKCDTVEDFINCYLYGHFFKNIKIDFSYNEILNFCLEHVNNDERLYSLIGSYYGMKKDETSKQKAFEYFQKGENDLRCIKNLAICYSTGIGIEKNQTIAKQYIDKILESNNKESISELALTLANLYGKHKNNNLIFEENQFDTLYTVLLAGTEFDDPNSYEILSKLYSYDKVLEEKGEVLIEKLSFDKRNEIELHNKALFFNNNDPFEYDKLFIFENGEVNYCIEFAKCNNFYPLLRFEFCENIDSNIEFLIPYYEKASEQGYYVNKKLANCYMMNGEYEKSIYYYKLANDEMGVIRCQLLNGNYDYIIEYSKKIINRSSSFNNVLGAAYLKKEMYKEAIECFTSEDISSNFYLSYFYYLGLGVEKNEGKAYELLCEIKNSIELKELFSDNVYLAVCAYISYDYAIEKVIGFHKFFLRIYFTENMDHRLLEAYFNDDDELYRFSTIYIKRGYTKAITLLLKTNCSNEEKFNYLIDSKYDNDYYILKERAYAYYKGIFGFECDIDKAYEIYKHLYADINNVIRIFNNEEMVDEIRYYLGCIYLNENFKYYNVEIGLELLSKVVHFYIYYDEMCKFFEKYDRVDHLISLYEKTKDYISIGNLYYKEGTKYHNLKKAFDYYLQAIKNEENYDEDDINYCYEHTLPSYVYYIVGKCYEKGEVVSQNIKMAIDYYRLAVEKNNIDALNALDELKDIETTLEYEISKINRTYPHDKKLELSSARDVFISWNHHDYLLKNKLCEILSNSTDKMKYPIVTCWESEGEGSGDLNRGVKMAIDNCKIFIVILTENSLKSEWVMKELEYAYKRFNYNTEFIKAIYIDTYNENGDVIFNCDKEAKNFGNYVIKLLENDFKQFRIDKNNPFNEAGIVAQINNAITKSMFIEYKENLIKKYKNYKSTLSNVIKEGKNNVNFIKPVMSFSECYVDRLVYLGDESYTKDDILKNKYRYNLIYGSAGSGKSLYLQNIISQDFKYNNFYFYLPCKKINEYLERKDDLLNILREVSFINYLPLYLNEQVTVDSLKGVFNKDNNCYILIDALDELSQNARNNLQEVLDEFRIDNVKFILTSRNNDVDIIISDSIESYYLPNLYENERNKLIDRIISTYTYKLNNRNIINDIFFEKNKFINYLEEISDDIRNNPLLVSNLIYIYFVKNELPRKKFEIIDKVVDIFINEVEDEHLIGFKYDKYLKNGKLEKILSFIALNKMKYSNESIEQLIIDYFEMLDEDDFIEIGKAVYKYLDQRDIISNDNLTHELFAEYFCALYLYKNAFYKAINEYEKVIKIKDEHLKLQIRDFEDKVLSQEVAMNYLMKVDYEYYLTIKNNKKLSRDNRTCFELFLVSLYRIFSESYKSVLNEFVSENRLYLIGEIYEIIDKIIRGVI